MIAKRVLLRVSRDYCTMHSWGELRRLWAWYAWCENLNKDVIHLPLRRSKVGG